MKCENDISKKEEKNGTKCLNEWKKKGRRWKSYRDGRREGRETGGEDNGLEEKTEFFKRNKEERKIIAKGRKGRVYDTGREGEGEGEGERGTDKEDGEETH